MIHLLSFAADVDLLAITQSLWQHKIPHRVRQLNGEQQLWLQDASQAQAALALCASSASPNVVKTDVTGSLARAKAWLTGSPITALVLILTLLVALLTQLGEVLTRVSALTFYPMVFDTQVYLVTGFDHLWQQPWRFISPVLLHFGWLHLVFNSLWWLDLGRRIELQSAWVLIILVMLTGLAGNLAQAWQEPSLFGGLSGVIYGLLGYMWVVDRWSVPRYHLPQGILVFMLLWLLLGLSNILQLVGFGSMANMAHLGGLLAGVVIGFWHSIWINKSAK
ncbi:MAG: rhomboid family intramembrane serine protease [Oceanospirillaceae bacterium]|nr:rhomboid family intramembrane serine protease [Oceanospirillaceae bacterium]MBT4442083.1 rhomboid family intramembrane serine protease [Oceanospirillaceae bacterium]MBT6078281.1 rhomboid family intramembrane serine protease [Oceanospirillaceae bacterium]MBT7330801.1 rhomboid family intramembrane serine protease [Oceanospirillaceae bacterium]